MSFGKLAARADRVMFDAIPRAHGVRLLPASPKTIADVVQYLVKRNTPGSRQWRGYPVHSPPMMFIQGLCPMVSMDGWNLGFAGESQYGRAVHELLPADHDVRISQLQAVREAPTRQPQAA